MTTPQGRSQGPQTKLVEVLNVQDAKALVRDRNQVQHLIPLDTLRYKGEPPQPGEIWYLDRYLGGWTFSAIVGYTHRGPFEITETPPDSPYVGYAYLDPTTFEARIWTGEQWRSFATSPVT